ncbi:hypothetical protein [Dongia sedimenti]|uniref:THUMP domain-containing protein n=1 Tax=Dongia sedimenti TaxID=3064282 RepID=A0ABU0YS17_9PROT|nr:hypothetical protein [Rhodospirillaceae bacterium R-7]
MDWNVVISASSGGYTRARALMREHGEVAKTHFYNILTMMVPSVPAFLAALEDRFQLDLDLRACVSRIAPVTETFNFSGVQDFETKACALARMLAPPLNGASFHVRMHRRGLKGLISSNAEERRLDEALIGTLEKAGGHGMIRFDDPDFVVDLETVDHRAGTALWSRDALQRYPFLKPD